MTNETRRLIALMKAANAGADYPDLSGLDLGLLPDPRLEQATVSGMENHRLKTYLAILLMRTMRDFTDTDGGVYKSHDAVDAIVELCRSERGLRKRLRSQIRRVLSSPRWQYDSPVEEAWTCIYCGSPVSNDGEGFARERHLETHREALPVEADDGFPFSQGHVAVARGHLLGCLCGLVRASSWSRHRSFFERELTPVQLEALESIVLSSGDALVCYGAFDWDYGLQRNRSQRP